MDILDRLEIKFGKYGIKNLTYILIGGQILAYLLVYSRPAYFSFFPLQGDLLLQGQIWRLISFIFSPPGGGVIYAIISWYLFYFFGTVLEQHWGSFRYLMYLLVGWAGMILLSFVFPGLTLTNGFIVLSVFLAFAYFFPELKVYVLFVIPVKVKWLGYLVGIGIILAILFGDVATKLITVVSVINFILFFGQDIFHSLRSSSRNISQFTSAKSIEKPNHICAVCGKNEKTDPDMQIRYCSKCTPTTCYCGEHIHDHEHIRKRIVN